MVRTVVKEGALGKFNTYVEGYGKPLYVVNGGPGLEYRYLYKWFTSLRKDRELVYYDQYGTGKDAGNHSLSSLNADVMVEQLHKLLIEDPRKKDIIAHSWGSYLLMSVLAKGDLYNIDKVIFMNPFALSYSRYLETGALLTKRFPESVMLKIGELSQIGTPEAFVELMEVATPYYIHDSNSALQLEYGSYESVMGDHIYETIVGFDHTNIPSLINKDILLIKSDDDFITMDHTAELQKAAKKTLLLTECGHYSFAEKNAECIVAISNFLGKSVHIL